MTTTRSVDKTLNNLRKAWYYYDSAEVEAIIESPSLTQNFINSKETKALFREILYEALHREHRILKILLKNANKFNVDISEYSFGQYGNQTLLTCLPDQNYDKKLKMILKAGANPFALMTSDSQRTFLEGLMIVPPLTESQEFSFEYMKIIFQHCLVSLPPGLNCDQKTCQLYYTICLAIINDDTKSIIALSPAIKDWNFSSIHLFSPIVLAIHLRNEKIIELLMKFGVSMDPFNKKYLQYPLLHLLIDNKCTKWIRYFIRKNINFASVKAVYGTLEINAINLLCFHGMIDILILLLSKNLLQEPDASGLPYICSAIENFQKETVEFLLDNEIGTIGNLQYFEFSDCKICTMLLEYEKYSPDLDIFIKINDFNIIYHGCDDISECLVLNHMKKMYLLNPVMIDAIMAKNPIRTFPDDEINWDNIKNSHNKHFYKELAKMKKIKISKYSLFDYLHFNFYEVTRYARNMNLHKIYHVSSHDFKTTFPHYGHILNLKYRLGARRRDLLEAAQDFLDDILYIGMPEMISDLIFKYLSNEQLAKFQNYSE